jgi:hypothetical protein
MKNQQTTQSTTSPLAEHEGEAEKAFWVSQENHTLKKIVSSPHKMIVISAIISDQPLHETEYRRVMEHLVEYFLCLMSNYHSVGPRGARLMRG